MKWMKMHKCSAAVMLAAAVICIWSGHKMTAPSQKKTAEEEE